MANIPVEITSTTQNGWVIRFVGSYDQSAKTLSGKFQALSVDAGVGTFYVYDSAETNAGFLINGAQVFSFGQPGTTARAVYFDSTGGWSDISDTQITLYNVVPTGTMRILTTMRWQGTGTIRPLDYSESYKWLNSAQQIYSNGSFAQYKPQMFDGSNHIDVKAQIFNGTGWADY